MQSILVFLLVFVPVYFVYALTWPPTLYWQDAGIYLSAIKTLGVAYPPGFPLYTVLGFIWTKLIPVGSLAQKVHAFSALWGAIAAGVIGLSARQIVQTFNARGKVLKESSVINPTRYRLYAVVIGLTAGWTYSLWAQSINAEVYSLHALFSALFLYITIQLSNNQFSFPGNQSQKNHWWLLVLTVGLSFANHPGSITFLPPVLYLAWQKKKDFWRRRKLVLLMLVVFLVVGFLPYLYLPWRASQKPPLNWGDPSTLRRFAAHLLGMTYLTEEKAFQAGGLPKFINFGVLFWQELFLFPILLGFWGIRILWQRNKSLLEILLIFMGTNWLVVYYYAKGGEYGFWLIPAYLTWLLLAANGIPRRFLKNGGLITNLSFFAFLVITMVLPLLLINWRYLDRSDYFLAEDFGKSILRSMGPDSVFFTLGDQPSSTTLYVQKVLNYRTDIAVLELDDLKQDFRRQHLQKYYPDLILPGNPGGELTDLVKEFVDLNLPERKIYFMSLGQVPDDLGYPLVPASAFWQVVRGNEEINLAFWDFGFRNENFLDQPMKKEARKKIDLSDGSFKYEELSFHQRLVEYLAQAYKNLGDWYYTGRECEPALRAYRKIWDYWPDFKNAEVEEKMEKCKS